MNLKHALAATIFSLALSPAALAWIDTLKIVGTLPHLQQEQQLAWSAGVSGGTPPYKFDIEKGSLPAGFRLDESTGSITGSSSSLAHIDFVLRVRDSKSDHARLDLRLIVTTSGSTLIPRFTQPSPPNIVNFGERYSWPLKPFGGLPPYSFSISAGSLPDGFLLNNDSQYPSISGVKNTLGSDTLGSDTVSFDLRISDSIGSSSVQTIVWTFAYPVIVSPSEINWYCDSIPICNLGMAGLKPYSILIGSARPSAVADLYGDPSWILLSLEKTALPALVIATPVVPFRVLPVEYWGHIALYSESALSALPVHFLFSSSPGNKAYPAEASGALTTTAEPTITVSLPSVELFAVGDEANVSTALTLRPKTANLLYAIHSDRHWVVVDKPTGTLKTDTSLVVTVYPKGLAPGLHEANIGFYDQSGQLMAKTELLLRIAPEGIPLQLSRHTVKFSSESSIQSLIVYNPNNTPASFQLRSDQDAYRVSPTSGSIPPRSHSIINLSASPQAPPEANLVLALNHAQLELVALSSIPEAQTCSSKPVSIEATFPGQHATISTHGSVRFRLRAFDGCGKSIQSGILSLRAPDNSLIPLHLDSIGDWHGSWRDRAGLPRVLHFIAQWQNLQGFKSEQLPIQVNIKP